MHELRLNQRLQLVACQLQGPLASASGPCFFANKKNSRPACPGLPWNRSVAQFLSATHQRSLRTPLSPLSSRAYPDFPTSPLSLATTYVVLSKENHMQLIEASTLDRK